MKLRLILLLLFTLMLSGCTALNTEEQLMVVVMGIDHTEDQQFRITVKVPSFASSSESGGGTDGYISLSATAKDFPSALAKLSSIAPRTLNYSQTRQLLIHNSALLAAPDLITTLSHVDGMRSQAIISICTSETKQTMEGLKASIGTRLSRYIDSTLNTSLKEGIIPDSTLIRTLSQINGGYQDAMLSIITQQSSNHAQQAAIPAMQKSSQGSSQQEESKENDILWIGAAAMDGKTLSGYLDGFETMLYRFICGEIDSITYTTDDGVYQLTSRFGPHFSVDQKANTDVLQIHGKINLLPQYGTEADLDDICQQLEQDTENLVKTLQTLRCDALGFGGHYSKKYRTLTAWEQSRWKDAYIAADTDVSFSLTLMNE